MSVLVRRPGTSLVDRHQVAADSYERPASIILELARRNTNQIIGLTAEGARSLLTQLYKIFVPPKGGANVTDPKTDPSKTRTADDLELDRILGTTSAGPPLTEGELIAIGTRVIQDDVTPASGALVELPPITERKTDPGLAVAAPAATTPEEDDYLWLDEGGFAGHPAVSPSASAASASKPAVNGAAQAGYPLGTVEYGSKGWSKSYGGPGQSSQPSYGGYGNHGSGGGYSGGYPNSSFHKCSHHCDPIQMGEHVVYAAAKRDFNAKDVAKVDVVYMLTTSMNTADFQNFWGMFFCFPITDMSAPDPELLRMHAERIAHFARTGSRVMVFCEGGHGRTGTVLSTVLGILEPEVVDPVLECRRRHCSEAVETAAQVAAVFKALGRELPAWWYKEPEVKKPDWRQQGKLWSESMETSFVGTRGPIRHDDTCDVCKKGDIFEPATELLHWHGAHIRHDACQEAVRAVEKQDAKKPAADSKAATGAVYGSSQAGGLSKKERKRRLRMLRDKTKNFMADEAGETLIICPACTLTVEPDDAFTILDEVGFHDECRKTAADNGVIEWYIQYVKLASKNPKTPVDLEFAEGHPALVDWETGMSSRMCHCADEQPCVLLTPNGDVVACTVVTPPVVGGNATD